MRNEPWVWPEVRDAGTSGAGAVPLRSAQMMGQQKKKRKEKRKKKRLQTPVIVQRNIKTPNPSGIQITIKTPNPSDSPQQHQDSKPQ